MSARLVLTVLAVLLGAGLLGLVAGSASAALAFLAVLVLAPTIRPAMRTPTDCPGRDLSWRIAQSMLAQAAAAALVVGFPVMLAATTGPADYRQAAPLILAISLTRAPLLVPLNAVQGVAVSYLVHAGRRFSRALLGVIGIVTGVGLGGSLAAWAVGPWLMATLFGSDYRVQGWVLGLLTLSATLLAVLTITGATCQATDRHAVFLAGWVVATSSAALLLLLPGSLEQRSVTALLGGPTLGLAIHVGALVLGSVRGRSARERRIRVDA
jgi:O-antigen/teichoic acid export membrane protein